MLSEIAYKVVGCFFENKLNFYIKFYKSENFSRSFCFYYTVCHLAVTKYAKK